MNRQVAADRGVVTELLACFGPFLDLLEVAISSQVRVRAHAATIRDRPALSDTPPPPLTRSSGHRTSTFSSPSPKADIEVCVRWLRVVTQVSCVSSVSEKCIVRLVSDTLGMSYARSLGAQGARSAEMHQRLLTYVAPRD